ncbi:hypothetical protein ANCCAN_26804 [Ancylostoma caninum]|uniref:Uncharacterized protein n=1 Tax=Ancylostoma caninum TaxID=29170 RepID=A0A368F955_ANCCA|nr:hypothetical protein ANCCAN_26804 [Ancylostoma caninum]
MAPQFPDFRRVRRRIRRTLCYGAKQPHSINLPLSELVVDFFNKRCPFDYMRPETSASISGRGYADPCTLVVAMVYLDRLRVNDKAALSVEIHDFFVTANTSSRKKTSSLKPILGDLEKRLFHIVLAGFTLQSNWDVMVDQAEFDRWLSFFEYWVANDFVMKNDFCTYNELVQLSSSFPMASLLQAIASFFGLMTLVYTVSIVSLFAIPSTFSLIETSVPENNTVRTVPAVTSPFEDREWSRISFPTEYDFIEELDIDWNAMHLEESGNVSSMLFLSQTDSEIPDCSVYEFERFPNRCCGLKSRFTDFSIHSFVVS